MQLCKSLTREAESEILSCTEDKAALAGFSISPEQEVPMNTWLSDQHIFKK